jgi:hypothetical protein
VLGGAAVRDVVQRDSTAGRTEKAHFLGMRSTLEIVDVLPSGSVCLVVTTTDQCGFPDHVRFLLIVDNMLDFEDAKEDAFDVLLVVFGWSFDAGMARVLEGVRVQVLERQRTSRSSLSLAITGPGIWSAGWVNLYRLGSWMKAREKSGGVGQATSWGKKRS